MQELAGLALATERGLRPGCAALREQDGIVGKALLARDASTPFGPSSLVLQACDSDERWALYEDYRVPVEREFGLGEAEARALVRRTRKRSVGLGLRLWPRTNDDGQVVGGIPIIGADEDDWPLAWYRRLGFREAARVPKHVL